MTLNQTLAALGFTTRQAKDSKKAGSKDILRDGEVVFTGTAGDVWAWLRGGRR